MSPLDYIETGLKAGDLEMIAEGYERLTSKSISIPKNQSVDKTAQEALQKIFLIASDAMIDNSEAKSNTNAKKEKTPAKKKKVSKKTSKKKTDPEEDDTLVFNDGDRTPMKEALGGVKFITNSADEKEIEENQDKARRTIKSHRNTVTEWKVECNECGEEFMSKVKMGEFGQKCKKCLMSHKRTNA